MDIICRLKSWRSDWETGFGAEHHFARPWPQGQVQYALRCAFYCTFELFWVVVRLRICGRKVALRDPGRSSHDEGGLGGVGHLDHESQTLNLMFDESKDMRGGAHRLASPSPKSLRNSSAAAHQDTMLVTCSHSC